MNCSTVDAACNLIDVYLSSDEMYPLIVSLSDNSSFKKIFNHCEALNLICTSDYCNNADSVPTIDRLIQTMENESNPSCLVGIGEYASLFNCKDVIVRVAYTLLKCKIVVICRHCVNYIYDICRDDKKFESNRAVILNSPSNYEIYSSTHMVSNMCWCNVVGFKELLKQMENSQNDNNIYCVKTSITIPKAKNIDSYDLLRLSGKNIAPRDCLSIEKWSEYLDNDSLDDYGVDHWRTFLKYKLQTAHNRYLEFVIKSSNDYDSYKKRLIDAILDVDVKNDNYFELYSARKEIIHNIGAPDYIMVDYVNNAGSRGHNSIYYLTDNTPIERQAIIKWISEKQTIPDKLELLYPRLADYLGEYYFSCNSKYDDFFSQYFSEYKKCKVLNNASDLLREYVHKSANAPNRAINFIDDRTPIVRDLGGKYVFLLWIDAISVEYLSYIQSRASHYRLKMVTHVARSTLPSITKYNSDFFHDWPESSCRKCKDFDDLLHEGLESPLDEKSELPLYLSKQLEIIDEELDRISSLLHNKTYRKVVLASDHGASRFALLYSDNIIEMKAPGEHSGRCCPVSDGDKPQQNIISENGYWSSADYDKFKYARKQGVELHGGATLEEVLVPVIEFTLFDVTITLTILTPVVSVSHNSAFILRIQCNYELSKAVARINGKSYPVESKNKIYSVEVDDIKRSGHYSLEIYEYDSIIESIPFTVENVVAKSNDDDWF